MVRNNNEILKQLQEQTREVAAIYVGTYIPRPCGIATYTKDLTNAINILNPKRLAEIAVLDRPAESYPYPWEAKFRINMYDLSSFIQAADYINRSAAELVCIQHEFGIFGGPSGEYVIPFMERIKKPIVTTLHTVTKSPPIDVLNIVQKIAFYSEAITVMAEACIQRLVKIYKIDKRKIVVIPHGVPDVAFTSPEPYKKNLGLEGRIIISAINLLSDNKGLEYVIESLPKVIKKHPRILFLIAGMTHPEVLKWQGEAYRNSLAEKAKELGVEANVMFDNRYVTLEELIHYLMASDFYITPYLGADQTASGTLAYALAAGKVCLSTPYVYAREVLADKRGVLIDFRNSTQIAQALNYYLDHPLTMEKTKRRAYDYGRQMIWHNVALKHLELFRLILAQKKRRDEKKRREKIKKEIQEAAKKDIKR
ncbi:MAG: glycosyltransferase family 4 protein [Candidatus Pacebacteria bacterium]|nr:glycosyltransferase family 4 protein [Candidatus Paceibacterota bacterium]